MMHFVFRNYHAQFRAALLHLAVLLRPYFASPHRFRSHTEVAGREKKGGKKAQPPQWAMLSSGSSGPAPLLAKVTSFFACVTVCL